MSDAPIISLTGLHLYPVKGAAGLSLQQCTLDSFGIVHDRRWMVVDSDGVFLSQRSLPRMALLSPRLEENALILDAPDMSTLRLPIEWEGGEEINVRIWKDRVRARLVSPDADKWMSRFLASPVRWGECDVRRDPHSGSCTWGPMSGGPPIRGTRRDSGSASPTVTLYTSCRRSPCSI